MVCQSFKEVKKIKENVEKITGGKDCWFLLITVYSSGVYENTSEKQKVLLEFQKSGMERDNVQVIVSESGKRNEFITV